MDDKKMKSIRSLIALLNETKSDLEKLKDFLSEEDYMVFRRVLVNYIKNEFLIDKLEIK